MALAQSMEKQGNFLFKYRGQFPVILFILAIPFISVTNYNLISEKIYMYCMSFATLLSCLGFFLRFYTIGTTPKATSGRNTKSQVADVLNSTGIYSLVRHPLYLANYLIWLGISVSTFNIYFVMIMSLLFWLYYERIMYAEECFLQRKFGENYLNWSNTLPAFFPSFLNFKKSETPFSFITVLRREYASILAAVVGFVFVEGFRNFFTNDIWIISSISLQFLIGTIILVLVLRTLKHYTQLLSEEGRS